MESLGKTQGNLTRDGNRQRSRGRWSRGCLLAWGSAERDMVYEETAGEQEAILHPVGRMQDSLLWICRAGQCSSLPVLLMARLPLRTPFKAMSLSASSCTSLALPLTMITSRQLWWSMWTWVVETIWWW